MSKSNGTLQIPVAQALESALIWEIHPLMAIYILNFAA